MTDAFPLAWPAGRPRTVFPARSRFDISMERATRYLLEEIRHMDGRSAIISTNVELRQDGLPYANRRAPSDKGVAVYFTHKGKQMCFACDRWDAVGDNIYAIAKSIDALRGIERWGSGSMVEQAFTGFLALPAPDGGSPWAVLGIPPKSPVQDIENAFRAKAKEVHPDMPNGGENRMRELLEARKAARAEIGL